jgi:hypothetical protein
MTMAGKITLITPPDFFENQNNSVLFVHLNEKEQDAVSLWLSNSEINTDLNLYVYNGEVDVRWALWAINLCQATYIDLDGMNNISTALSGYLLSKNSIYYKTEDENLAAIYNHINNNRVPNVEKFLESILQNGQTN